MRSRYAGALSALGVLAVLGAAVALTAEAGSSPGGRATSSALLHPVRGSEIHGVVSLVSTPPGHGTLVELTVHGLRSDAAVVSRLHAGSSLDRLSASSTAIAVGRANAAGSFRSRGHVLFRFDHEVRLSDVGHGAHVVVLEADGKDVAYAFVPRA